MNTRLVAALTGLAGIATLATTLGFTQLREVIQAKGCYTAGDVIAFELATTQAELIRIFHPLGDACRAKSVAAMDAVNTFDMAAYIPSYTAFAVLAALFLARGAVRRPLVLAAIGVALLALACDYVETITLLAITPDVEDNVALAARSSAAAWTKFAALAVHAGLLGAICFTGQPRRRILGGLLLLPLPAFAVMVADPARHSLLTYALAAGWAPVMLLALWQAIRPPTAQA